jgi:hypothetical protein
MRKLLLNLTLMGALIAVQPLRAADPGEQLDRLELDTTSVTGNQELPRVMVIVPWKDAGIGELSGRPVNSLLDETLAPIDREVFQRQVSYHDQLYSGAAQDAAAAPPASD